MRTRQIVWHGIAASAAVLLVTAAQAGTWVATKDSCQLWDPNPQLEETVTWSGACANGRAEGAGSAKWTKGGAEIESDEGEWRDGRQAGKGVQTWPGGRYEGALANGEPNGRGVLTLQKLRYEGEFRDGRPNGTGSLTAGGDTVSGTWKDGCLQGPRKAAIGIPLSACH
jgi:MORN repeat